MWIRARACTGPTVRVRVRVRVRVSVPITRGDSGHVSLDIRSTVTTHPITHSLPSPNKVSIVSPFMDGASALAPASPISLPGAYTHKERVRVRVKCK